MQFPVIDTARWPRASTSRYVIVNTVFAILFFIATMVADDYPFSRWAYNSVLLAICTAPLFLIDHRYGRYHLLKFFGLAYWTLYCFADVITVLLPDKQYIVNTEFESRVDILIAFGIVAFFLGYRLVVFITSLFSVKGFYVNEWAEQSVKKWGMLLAVGGLASFIAVFFIGELGALGSFISNLKILAPIGELLLIYLAFKAGKKQYWVYLALLIIFEFMLGFIANTKELSFRLIAYTILSYFVLIGRIKLLWVIAVITGFIIYAAIFYSYRLNVIQVSDMTPAEALEQLDKTREKVAQGFSKVDTPYQDAAYKFISRVDSRQYVERIVANTGRNGINYQDGFTVALTFYSFVPRMFWPEKPEISIGRLFNQEFRISASKDTYIPPSQLGEFYWNYGLWGAIVSMLVLGMIIGFIGVMTDLSKRMTAPRFVLLLLAIYLLCLRFETGIALQYSLYIKITILIFMINIVIKKFYNRASK